MKALLASLSLAASATSAWALQIQLDYTYDLADDNFFGTHAAAKSALEKAAADIGNLITSHPVAVPTDVFTGSSDPAHPSKATTATIDWSLNFQNPTSTTMVTLENFSLPADTVRIYVGMRPLTGSVLGQGGPAGAGYQISASSSTNLAAAVADAQAKSNAALGRGTGPIIGSLQGQIDTTTTNLRYGALVGSLTFDDDTDNNGTEDSFATLNQYWHFDATTAPASGQNDFYSVALHEMLHSIGFGSSKTWNDDRSGTKWLGPAAIALNGGDGTNLVTTDGHIRSGYMSTRLLNGVPQEAAMDPSLTTGTRKYLTAMDGAFLRDIGYTTVPEPGTASLCVGGLSLLAGQRRRRRILGTFPRG